MDNWFSNEFKWMCEFKSLGIITEKQVQIVPILYGKSNNSYKSLM